MAAALVIPEHGEIPLDGHAGRIERHEDHALPVIGVGVGVGDPHHDGDGTARRHRPAAPPLAARDHVVVAIALDPACDVGGIAGCHRRLRHREAGTDLALE